MAHGTTGTSGEAIRFTVQAIIITAGFIALPSVFPEGLWWLSVLVPLPVFLYLTISGTQKGQVIITRAFILAAGISLLFGNPANLLFTCTFLPLGFILARSWRQGESILRAGSIGLLATTAGWFSYITFASLGLETNPYSAFAVALEESFSATLSLYSQSTEITAEHLHNLEAAFTELHRIIMMVLPGLIAGFAVFFTWLNLLLANWLLKKTQPEARCWPGFPEWVLPDFLVWGVIASGILIFLPAKTLTVVGLNSAFFLATLYLLQGLAILTSLMQKWTTPRPVRVLIYVLLVIQAYGLLLLAIIGLVDVWADFRKNKETKISL